MLTKLLSWRGVSVTIHVTPCILKRIGNTKTNTNTQTSYKQNHKKKRNKGTTQTYTNKQQIQKPRTHKSIIKEKTIRPCLFVCFVLPMLTKLLSWRGVSVTTHVTSYRLKRNGNQNNTKTTNTNKHNKNTQQKQHNHKQANNHKTPKTSTTQEHNHVACCLLCFAFPIVTKLLSKPGVSVTIYVTLCRLRRNQTTTKQNTTITTKRQHISQTQTNNIAQNKTITLARKPNNKKTNVYCVFVFPMLTKLLSLLGVNLNKYAAYCVSKQYEA